MSRLNKKTKGKVDTLIIRVLDPSRKYSTNQVSGLIGRSHEFTEQRLSSLFKRGVVNRDFGGKRGGGRVKIWYL